MAEIQAHTADEANATGTLPERIFNRIRRAIVEGEIPAGTKISEPELAKRFGISRAPLREAIGRLEACKLVVRRPNVGARVASLTLTGLLELYDLRDVLEGLAARLAAERMTSDEIADLRKLLVQHQGLSELQEGIAYFQKEGDLDFHYRIVQGSHNSRLIALLCNDLYHLVRMYRYQFGMPGARANKAFSEHEHIADAIEHRDAELAELLMRRHIRAARANVETQLHATDPGIARTIEIDTVRSPAITDDNE